MRVGLPICSLADVRLAWTSRAMTRVDVITDPTGAIHMNQQWRVTHEIDQENYKIEVASYRDGYFSDWLP